MVGVCCRNVGVMTLLFVGVGEHGGNMTLIAPDGAHEYRLPDCV